MAAIISTYRHDYVAPQNNRYSFLKKLQFSADPCQEICPCVEEKPKPDFSALGEKCEGTQWTRPAPTGKVELPRDVNEASLVSYEQSTKPCSVTQPNRFLKTISNVYPELYERLKNMPKDELRRSIESSRFKTTYQVDYCHQVEHPTGLYDQPREKKDDEIHEHSKLNDPCKMLAEKNYRMKDAFGGGFAGGVGGGLAGSVGSGFAGGVGGGFAGSVGGDFEGGFRRGHEGDFEGGDNFGKDLNKEEIKMNKPVKVSFTENATRGSTAHWDAGAFSKQMTISEYMDKLCRTGLIVMENKLHDHSNCRGGNNCTHSIKSGDPQGLKQLTTQTC